MRTLTIDTTTHGRMLIRESIVAAPFGWIVGFHGYAQNAEDMLADLERLPGAEMWNLASVQALNRFYARGEERIVANWMTRQDREIAIADNITYVDRAIASLAIPIEATLVCAGFSQGAAMAYRAALKGARPVSGVIALGGDVPPDVKQVPVKSWPRILIGAGQTDFWYTAAKVDADVKFLETQAIPFELVRFTGGHEWTDEFRTRAAEWLSFILQSSCRSWDARVHPLGGE